MKTLQFTYEMQTQFAGLVRDHHYSLKCIPKDSERQKVLECRCEIIPSGKQGERLDGFYNKMMFGSILSPHDRFDVAVTGIVQTGISVREAILEPERLGSFRSQTVYTEPGAEMKQFLDALPADRNLGAYEKALLIMGRLGEHFTYRQGTTTIRTTAREAFAQGCGVCQDWCHIMLGLCRRAGIPCRYIVGMLSGEGYSHAWVEIADRGYWYALDPTNHTIVQDDHIKISCGRDYQDCIVSRGIFKGPAEQAQHVRVLVKDVSNIREYKK